ncbi:translocation/assembly module TamB domain-containing protein [Sphingobium subterraneum]|uniref:Translocation and assembly module TamB n=1 Tax=Sphingobium subterraneum TaxID=627688 RepID=A0A841J0R8_9SPHN|nr:translocation/assembly module TamB domain-containing protein [Sphingobium subterraneum]MBB6123116.1 translocation and assembly module TamB [Sphingobium subterraneum]
MTTENDIPEVKPRRRGQRWQAVVLAALLLVLALVAGAGVWLDSQSGHRFIVGRIAGMAPQSGLRIGIGSIEGSIYRRAELRDVRLSDPGGVFLSAPRVRLEWWPLSWLSNRLDIDELTIPDARLHKMPRFNPSKVRGPLLPDFDIRLMALRVDRLRIDPGIAGPGEVLAISGDADVRSGRAVLDLNARALKGDDRLVLALDSRPDDNRFDIDLTINAPAGGVLAAMAGLKQDANLRVRGDGDWRNWNGSLVATLDRQPAAGFALGARSGVYMVRGTVEGSAIAGTGMLARMTAPQMAIDAQGTFADRLLFGRLEARSRAVSLHLDGGIDLRRSRYDNLTADVRLAQPSALFRNMAARNLLGRARLDGAFSDASFEYLFRADQLAFGRTVLHGVKAKGAGRLAGADAQDRPRATIIPVDLVAARVDGQGELVGSILRNFHLTGTLQKLGNVITSGPLKLRSDKLNGQLVALFDLKSGRYDLALGGDIRGLTIPGLGVVDVTSRIKAVPGARGAFGLTGAVEAKMRRLDNGFLRTLGGGLPVARSSIALGPNGQLVMRGLSVRAPLLVLNGEGVRFPDGTVRLSGSGRHARYGALRLLLTGKLDRPKVDLLLARPMDAAGLRDVHVLLDPDAQGYRYTAQGGSTLGPFTSQGRILLPTGGQTVIAVDQLAVGGVTGQGRIVPVADGLQGQIDVAGQVAGSIQLQPIDHIQVITANLTARDAQFAGPAVIAVRRGTLQATLKLDPAGTYVDATVRANGVQVGGFRVNRLAANARLVDGAGQVRASVSGQRGRLFDLQILADVTPDRVNLQASGTLDRQAIRLTRAARFHKEADGGWRLDPATILYRGGSMVVGGRLGGGATTIDLVVDKMPLSVLDLSNSDLGLGGLATGRLAFTWETGAAPTGAVSVRIRGLTRSGTAVTSTPVDIGLNAQLTHQRMALRAVAETGGKTIGRAQALLSPLGDGGLLERLRNAPLRAQLRYNGPADMLWRLSGVEIIDLGGPVTIVANVQGTGANPLIQGAVATNAATLDSPVTGMRLTGIRTQGRFDGSKLVLSSFTGTTRGGGSVSGQGTLDFSLGQGVGIDLALQANGAELLNRDDIGATVTGPITIRSDGNGGTIGGTLDVVRSRFTLGRAAAVAQIPELRIIERNGRRDDFDPVRRAEPWRLDIKARARNRLMVDGMGLSSEWRMNLDIGGDVANPRLIGSAEMVRGSYDFAGRRFDLTAGTIRFDGSVPTNPTLDITAEATVSDLSATIRVTGTSAQPVIAFSSVPSLPEDEVLSRILFGSSITQLSAPEALQLAAAVGSLRGSGGGLDPINTVRKAAGLDRLRILPADATTGQGTSVAVGKYITRKTYVELITDAQGYSATRIEYQVTRWLSLLGSISTLGRQSATVRVSKDY